MIFIAITITLFIALGIPIDNYTWDSALNIRSGYPTMFLLVEVGISILSILSFFIAAYLRGNKGYILIGISAILILIGRNILLNADTWLILPIGLSLLGIGSWLACAQIRHIYLWL